VQPANALEIKTPKLQQTQSSEKTMKREVKENELKPRVRESLLLDDFFIRKVHREEPPRMTLHRALLEF